jgi:hypothetical protein
MVSWNFEVDAGMIDVTLGKWKPVDEEGHISGYNYHLIEQGAGSHPGKTTQDLPVLTLEGYVATSSYVSTFDIDYFLQTAHSSLQSGLPLRFREKWPRP